MTFDNAGSVEIGHANFYEIHGNQNNFTVDDLDKGIVSYQGKLISRTKGCCQKFSRA